MDTEPMDPNEWCDGFLKELLLKEENEAKESAEALKATPAFKLMQEMGLDCTPSSVAVATSSLQRKIVLCNATIVAIDLKITELRYSIDTLAMDDCTRNATVCKLSALTRERREQKREPNELHKRIATIYASFEAPTVESLSEEVSALQKKVTTVESLSEEVLALQKTVKDLESNLEGDIIKALRKLVNG